MKNIDEEDKKKAVFFRELTEYEKRGVRLLLEDGPASPMQIVQACIMREDVIYMRDYVMDDRGDIEKLCFNVVKIK